MEIVAGTVHRVTYQNAQNGYCVIKLKPSEESQKGLFDKETDRDSTVTVTGSLAMLKPGDEVELTGEWKRHPKHGAFLDVTEFHTRSPTTSTGLKNFLASDHFKGIGPVLADKLVETFGDELVTMIENAPERLREVKGITKAKAAAIVRDWHATKARREETIALQGWGISLNLSQKIIDHYQGAAVARVKENPYQLALEIWGVGFQRADEIARGVGFGIDHPYRVRSGVRHALVQAVDDGHMYLPRTELIAISKQLLGVGEVAVEREIDGLIKDAELVVDKTVAEDAVYLKSYYQQEKELAEGLIGLAQDTELRTQNSGSRKNKNQLPELIEKYEHQHKIQLAAEQKQVVRTAIMHPVTILTGGPGTGKSTTIRAVVELFRIVSLEHIDPQGLGAATEQSKQARVVLTAPTGRAAKRMGELGGMRAFTLHRLLKLKPGEPAEYDETNPLPYDLIVVDEVSMLDTFLAHQLVKAIRPGAHLLLVGDADQLPSVQAGNVLADLIGSKRFPTVELKTIFRQAQKSAIVQNAHRIRKGQFPSLPPHPTDFYLFEKDSIEDAAGEIVQLVTERIPAKFKFDPQEDVQVLAPLYKTAAGVSELNRRLQETLNPPKPGRGEVKLGWQTLREGDRVMQLKNNYDKEVFNGDIGKIVDVQHRSGDKGDEMRVRFPEQDGGRVVTYEGDAVRELTLAYATSVHKSQGSEYPVVVMPILTSHYIMLQRNLLYTAITRAKKLVVLVGSKRALFIALGNDKPQLRYTGLRQRLAL